MTTEQCQALGQESLGSLLFFFFWEGKAQPASLGLSGCCAVLSHHQASPGPLTSDDSQALGFGSTGKGVRCRGGTGKGAGSGALLRPQKQC